MPLNLKGCAAGEVSSFRCNTGSSKFFPRSFCLCRASDAQPHPDDPQVMRPSNAVHVDFTTQSGPLRLQWALPEEYDELRGEPFAIVQVSNLMMFGNSCS